jgi:pseudaminic acid synthase
MRKITIVAEVSANHGFDLQVIKKTLQAISESGADAIKLQTYLPETITLNSDKQEFIVAGGTLWDGSTLHDLYAKAYTPWEWHKEIKKVAESLGLMFFSTPFDHSAVDFLEELDVPMYKIASFEIHDLPLIKYVASKGKPIIISTGIATIQDIEEAISACRSVGNNNITLLKCTSEYPSLIEDANLLTIPDMRERFGVDVGLSDHTPGYIVPVTAVPYGISIIEKHFILDRSIGGPDASFSMEPQEFKEMIENVRMAEKAIGKVDYELTEKKLRSRKLGRSLFASKDIKKGEQFTYENIKSVRPSDGLPPKYIDDIVGKVASVDITFASPLKWEMIEGAEEINKH